MLSTWSRCVLDMPWYSLFHVAACPGNVKLGKCSGLHASTSSVHATMVDSIASLVVTNTHAARQTTGHKTSGARGSPQSETNPTPSGQCSRYGPFDRVCSPGRAGGRRESADRERRSHTLFDACVLVSLPTFSQLVQYTHTPSFIHTIQKQSVNR